MIQSVSERIEQEANAALRVWPKWRINSSHAIDYWTKGFSGPYTLNSRTLPNERSLLAVLPLFKGQGKGVDMDGAKGTALGLLNAATQFVQHEGRAKSSDHRLDSL